MAGRPFLAALACATIQRKQSFMLWRSMMSCILRHSSASSRSMVAEGSVTPPAGGQGGTRGLGGD